MINDPKTLKFANRRIFLIFLFQSSFFGILIYRLFNLQIIHHKEYLALSNNNQFRSIVEPTPRGIITDCNDIIVAENRVEFLIIMDSKMIFDLNIFINKIKTFIILDEQNEIGIHNLFHKKRRFIEIKSVQFDDFISIKYLIESLPEILVSKKYVRVYPFDKKIAHLIGYVINNTKTHNSNHQIYTNDFKVGKIGIEEKYNEMLSGSNKIIKIQVDSKGKQVNEIDSNLGKSGTNIKLTINSALQEMIYDATQEFKTAVVVIDIKKQALIGMISSPSFNPEMFNNEELRKNEWEALSINQDQPLFNKAISGLYSPGSTFKVIVALAALELGVIDQNTTIFCKGGYKIGNRSYHCLHHHRTISLHNAIVKSCNSFFYSLAKKIDINFLEKIASNLGLGEISNLNLRGESKGIIPSKVWKLKKLGQLWYIGDTANYMIGQGYLSSNALQLCTAVSSIASGNIINLSILEDECCDKIITKNQLIKEENFNIVRKAMFDVVNSSEGTSYNSIGSKYKKLKICGKTGTVQTSSKKTDKDHSVFIGYAPFDDPKYGLAVIGESMGYGASFAAPLAGKIFEFLNIES